MSKRKQKQRGEKRQSSCFTNTSIQHLYQLLGRNIREAQPSPILVSVDRKYTSKSPGERLKINLKYSPKSNDIVNTYDQVGQNKQSILQGFTKSTKKYNSQQKKKAFSVQNTNSKLKNIILRKRQQKKVTFFTEDQAEYQRQNISILQKLSTQIETKVNIEQNKITAKRYQTSPQEKKDQQMKEEAKEMDLASHFLKFKQSLRLKPIDYQVKKSKNNKFTIMGLSMKKHKLRYNKKQIREHLYEMSRPLEGLQLSIINQEKIDQNKNWKIDSIPLIISENNEKFASTNISKLKKKNSFQSLINRCLPYLAISEHILWKLQDMAKYYSLILLSFRIFTTSFEANNLPKYHKKHVRYTYYVGSGNNRFLICELMQKRWWWKQTSNINEANLVWTQHKVKALEKNWEEQADDIRNKSLLIYTKGEKQRQQRIKKKYIEAKQNIKYKQLFSSFQCAINQVRTESQQFQPFLPPSIIYNHMSGGKYLGNKKSLFFMFKVWFEDYKNEPQSLFQFIPQTFHITTDKCSDFAVFQTKFQSQNQEKHTNLWIVKPGQNSNRGRGIFLTSSIKQITQSIVNRVDQGGTTIVQKYLTNLFLYNGRKFDIRTYLLCITIGRNSKFYWFSQGYLRTSSQPYNLKEYSIMTHLTNDAIQNQGDQYGKYQKGNKLSYNQFQNYLDENYSSSAYKMTDLLKQMKQIGKKIAAASYPVINEQNRTGFQLFGIDFLIDSNFKPWLLEVNTNPCLQQSSPLLQKLIPYVVQNVLRMGVDTLFPPTVLPNKESQYIIPEKMCQWSKFELIFDSLYENDKQWERLLIEKINLVKYSQQKQERQ